MTSEGQHRPGQEPDEVSPDAGGTAPYGERQPQQDPGRGNPAAPDLGWAPPPPTDRPSASTWVGVPDQPPSWAPPSGQAPARGAARVPTEGEPPQPNTWGSPGGAAEPAWATAPADPPAGAAWAGSAQPPANAWAARADQQPANGRQAEQATPGDRAQPSWAPAEQAAGDRAQPGWPPAEQAAPTDRAQPSWAPAEQAAPAWAQQQSGARGAARVPQADDRPANGWTPPDDDAARSGGWAVRSDQDAAGANGWGSTPPPTGDEADRRGAGQDDAARSGGWAAGNQDDPASSGGWRTAQADDPASSGGWRTAQADDPASSGGWRTAQEDPARGAGPSTQDAAPRSAGRASVPVPPAPAATWTQPENGARGAAQVSQAGSPAEWSNQDDADNSGGWPAALRSSRDDDPALSGGWATDRASQDDPARSGGWVTDDRASQDDPARSGGWAVDRDAADRSGDRAVGQSDDRPQAWTGDESAPPRFARAEPRAEGWPPATAQDDRRDDQQGGREWPAAQEQAGGWGAAPAPAAEERPQPGGWTPPEQPARASASVAVPAGPAAWGTPADAPPQQAGAEHTGAAGVEPWAPGEAWGRANAEPAQREDDRESRRDDAPAYQPAPGPGISPANAVPLPPQEQRIPGASLASAPPADYVPPAAFGGPADPGEQHGRESDGAPSGRAAAPWGQQEQEPAAPAVPAPRVSPEGDNTGRAPGDGESATGRASASASVPLASRVMPPTDQALRPGGSPAAQPRVYGRPARPEPEDESVEDRQPEHGAPPRFDEQDRNRFDEQGPGRFDQPGQNRFDGPDDRPRFDEQDRTRFDQPGPARFDEQDRTRFDDRSDAPPAFGSAPSSAPPDFPGALPAFGDPTSSNRPMNGVRPHGPDDRQADPFGGPPAGGPPPGGVPGYGHPAHDPAHGGFGSPFPPAGQQFPPAGQPFPPAPAQSGPSGWPQESAGDQDQGRFDAFKPDAEPKAEQPVPKVRNGKVLAIVVIAAVMILAIPLGLLSLLGKIGGDDDKPAAFNPAVGSCVKRSGESATAANCADQDAFTVVSRVDAKEKCGDPALPHVVLPGSGADRVLCLKPATAAK